MNDLKKHAVALSIILVLFSIKFIVVPLIDWQDEQISKLTLLERKANKIHNLLENQTQLITLQNETINQLDLLTKKFYLTQEAELFKREQQKIIETELTEYKLKIKNIGWQTTIENSDVSLNQFSINYSFSGTGEAVVNYLLSLSSNEKYSELVEYNVTFSKQKPEKIGRMNVRLRRVYFMNKKTRQVDNIIDQTDSLSKLLTVPMIKEIS